MRWRERLVRLAWGGVGDDGYARGNIHNYPGFHDPASVHAGEITSAEPIPYPEGDPLVTLIYHSDCEDEIAAEDCGPLADRLQEILDTKMPARALYDELRPATERFIAGLRRAAAAGEPVEFG
jgi:hypothetical protein